MEKRISKLYMLGMANLFLIFDSHMYGNLMQTMLGTILPTVVRLTGPKIKLLLFYVLSINFILFQIVQVSILNLDLLCY